MISVSLLLLFPSIWAFAPPLTPLFSSHLRHTNHLSPHHHQQLHQRSVRVRSSLTLPASSSSASIADLQTVLPSQSLLDAVQKANNKLTISDAASLSGLSLASAQSQLLSLSTLTQASLQVSNDGDIVYNFPSDYRTRLTAASSKAKANAAFLKIWPKLFYGLKISFGVTLLVSLFAIFTTISVISSSSSSDDRDDRRRGGGRGGMGGGFGMNMWGPSPFDFFYYRPYRRCSKRSEQRGVSELFTTSVWCMVYGVAGERALKRAIHN